MLTLDPTTLFFWELSNISKKRKYNSGKVTQWVSAIPKDAMAGSRLPSVGKRSSYSITPSFTNQSTITASSLHTQRNSRPPKIHINPEPEDVVMREFEGPSYEDGQFVVQEDGGISDRNEIGGEEHEDAVKSPPKGSGVRLSSKVSF